METNSIINFSTFLLLPLGYQFRKEGTRSIFEVHKYILNGLG